MFTDGLGSFEYTQWLKQNFKLFEFEMHIESIASRNDVNLKVAVKSMREAGTEWYSIRSANDICIERSKTPIDITIYTSKSDTIEFNNTITITELLSRLLHIKAHLSEFMNESFITVETGYPESPEVFKIQSVSDEFVGDQKMLVIGI